MAIYTEIVSWSLNKPMFIRDAIRRLLANTTLSNTDIGELVSILKSETGFTDVSVSGIPVSDTHIPTSSCHNNSFAKLISIKKPINICALYGDAELNFNPNGLTLVYGNNGSGKSSYSRLLKKLCWSRDNNTQLKKNVNTQDATPQSVKLSFEHDGSLVPFEWTENNASHASLNSIFVFDSNCASIYINNENPSEYKPIGIDILDKLIELCKSIDIKIDAEIRLLSASKPNLDTKYAQTNLGQWYNNVETISPQKICEKLIFPESAIARKKELSSLLSSGNPIQAKQILSQKKIRYVSLADKLFNIEQVFSIENISRLQKLKQDLVVRKNAYEIAKGKLSGDDPLNGVGSNTWRKLWDAARLYAITEIHPKSNSYPDFSSSDICELCQQPLGEDAKRRMERFNLFIEDQTSKKFDAANKLICDEITSIEQISIERTDTCNELIAEMPSFEDNFKTFVEQIVTLKQLVVGFLKSNEDDLKTFIDNMDSANNLLINNLINLVDNIPTLQVTKLSPIVKAQNTLIDKEVIQKDKLIQSRVELEKELLDIESLEFLTSKKDAILKYIEECKLRDLLSKCKAKTNTTSISKKIGDIFESQSIQIQHNEFISHLSSLSGSISSKVRIKKSRTASGVTYQKCSFVSIGDSLNSILSEGEQKVVALANFLSECTIEGAKNSIVFDDPVNSLDIDFREAIAKKIVALSSDRQIIVLTHDLYFLRLLIDIHKQLHSCECAIIGLTQTGSVSGIPSDEIPYLAKNVQERIDTISMGLDNINSISLTDTSRRESETESLRSKMRRLLEKTVEDIIVNKTIQRFNKNITFKEGYLSSIVVTEKTDIDFLLMLFGKYSTPEHDGGVETIPHLPDSDTIRQDLHDFKQWKDAFVSKVKAYKAANGIVK